MMVRAPTFAPLPITTNAPIEADGSTRASGATDASVCTPAAKVGTGASTCAAFAKVRYGDLLRITAQGAAVSAPFMITALALVPASFEAYLGLARNVRSPGPASSSFATRRISMAASPSTGQSNRRASSPRVTGSRISLGRRGHPLDEPGHAGHMQAMGHLAQH